MTVSTIEEVLLNGNNGFFGKQQLDCIPKEPFIVNLLCASASAKNNLPKESVTPVCLHSTN
jgi:hypothetical protein